MMILGVDPGSHHTGYGIIEKIGSKSQYVTSGSIDLNPKDSLANRLAVLFQTLEELLTRYPVHCGVVEKIFFAKNAQSALTLGHARGVILLQLARHQFPIFEYTPLEIKQAVVGVGRASKDQVEYMVRVILNQAKRVLTPDEADALGVAITHSHLLQNHTTHRVARTK